MIITIPVFSQIFIEAESGTLNSVKVEKISGSSGDGYAHFRPFAKGSIVLTCNIEKGGDYAIILNYWFDADDSCSVSVEIDDVYFSTRKLSRCRDYNSVYVNNIASLEKGEHKIKITGYSGDWYLDFVQVVSVTDEIRKKVKPSSVLCTPDPSKEAQKVYDYLLSIEGKNVLSGQQIYNSNTQEIDTVYNAVGKYPAVLGIDLIDFSPSRVEHGTNGGRVIQVAKEYWEEGGIITCCWHWNAPAGLYNKNEQGKRWYEGFRTEASNFDFAAALKNPESENYKLILRDIDAIAKQLKLLQKANVPVLWRPLHEASGGWFWWGSKGSKNYIELYKLIYDRLVNCHHLNNLIWVWNGQDPQWYPGDEYVDIISYDYYPQSYRHTAATDLLAKIQSATETPKLCALSENGALPNVVIMEREKSPWLWWCTWNGDFTTESDGKTYSEKTTKLTTLKLYYDNPYTITKDEVPDLK